MWGTKWQRKGRCWRALSIAPETVALCFLCCVTCATQARPDATVFAYADAVERGDVEVAWSMLGREARGDMSRQEFADRLRGQPEENQRFARELRGAARSGAGRINASLSLGYGRTLRLVQEGDDWRIDSDILDFWPNDTPARALGSFVHACEARRYDVLLALSPERFRKLMTVDQLRSDFEGPRRAELVTLTSKLKQHMNDRIESTGNYAILRYDEVARVQFVREPDGWKIEDPD